MLSPWQSDSLYSPSDIIIVGAGLCGLFTALALREKYPQKSIRVVERGSYSAGASSKNAGFACFGSPSELLDDIDTEGESKAAERLSRRFNGLKLMLKLAGVKHIDYQENDGFELFLKEDHSSYENCLAQLERLNELACRQIGFEPYEKIEMDQWPFRGLAGAIRIKGEGVLNSGKLLQRLYQLCYQGNISLQFGTEVKAYEGCELGWRLKTSAHPLEAQQVIFCTNAYTPLLIEDLPIVPGRGQVLITEPLPELQLKGSFHLEQGYYYFRMLGDRLMLGGGRHLAREEERTYQDGASDVIQNKLEELLREVILPGRNFTIEGRWSGVMAFGPNNEKEVILKELKPGLFVAARLGGMGIAISSQVGRQVAEMIRA